MKQPRLPCPVCRRSIAVHNGKFNKHRCPRTRVACRGSKLPVQVTS